MKCTIEINDLRLYCRHGVMEQERIVGNEFLVTATLCYPFAEAAEADALDSTLNYAEAIGVIREVMDRPVDLIETAAMRIREALLERFPLISGGKIRVSKPTPPVAGSEVASVAATIEW